MSNSDTPRTDAAIFIAREGDCAVDPEEMRQLERYLAAADKRADAAEADAKRLRAENDEIAGLNHGQFLLLEYMRPILKSAKDLSDNAEEYDFADGLGQGALQEYWDALNTALEPATDAIYEEIDEAMRHD